MLAKYLLLYSLHNEPMCMDLKTITFKQTQPAGIVIYSPIVSDADAGTNRDISFQLVSPVRSLESNNYYLSMYTITPLMHAQTIIFDRT